MHANPSAVWKSFGRALLVAVALAAAAPGCATTREVEDIVARSNAAALAGAMPEPGAQSAAAADETVQRIEEFIAAHPEEEDLTAPLRVREAMLLAASGHRDLAEAAFEQVPEANLHSERDRALFAVRAYLPWWFEKGPRGRFDGDEDEKKARDALDDFARVCDGLPAQSDTRFYLEEMRAWIAVVLTREVAEAEAGPIAQSAAQRFAEQLDPGDFGVKREAGAPSPLAAASPGLRLRKRLRPRAVFEKFEKAATDQRQTVAWSPAWLAEWMKNN